MKKADFLKTILVSVFVVMPLFLTGCNRPDISKYGWYSDLDVCLDAAKKENKNVFLLFTRDNSDQVSLGLKEKVFFTDEFKYLFSDQYKFCCLDFSIERLKMAAPAEDASSGEKKIAAVEAKRLDRDMKKLVIYGAQTTPLLLVLTSEGYVISCVSYIPSKTPEEFADMMHMFDNDIISMTDEIKSLKNLRGVEKVQAIDRIYETTNNTYRYSLKDLILEVPKLDKKNQSGLVGKYILAAASTKSLDYYLDRHPEKAPDAYIAALNSNYLDTNQKQQCYYAAAYIIGSQDPSIEVSEKIMGYLQKAIDLDAESPLGQQCAHMLEKTKIIYERQKAFEEQKEKESEENEEAAN